MEDNNLKQQIADLLRANPDTTYRVEDISDALHYHGSAAFKLIVQELARLEREKKLCQLPAKVSFIWTLRLVC